MKRLAFSALAAACALTFVACEGRPVSELPEHYQHKLGAGHGSEEAEAPAAKPEKDAHAKPAAREDHAKPVEGEKSIPNYGHGRHAFGFTGLLAHLP